MLCLVYLFIYLFILSILSVHLSIYLPPIFLTAFRNAFARDGHQQQDGQEHRGSEADALARHRNVQPEGAKRKHGDDGARQYNCKEVWVLKCAELATWAHQQLTSTPCYATLGSVGVWGVPPECVGPPRPNAPQAVGAANGQLCHRHLMHAKRQHQSSSG